MNQYLKTKRTTRRERFLFWCLALTLILTILVVGSDDYQEAIDAWHQRQEQMYYAGKAAEETKVILKNLGRMEKEIIEHMNGK